MKSLTAGSLETSARAGGRWLSPGVVAAFAGLIVLLSPWIRDPIVQTGSPGAYILVLALFATLALTPVMLRLGHRWGILDHPTARKIHPESTPITGGLAVYLGVLTALTLGEGLQDGDGVVILAAASVLLVISLIDDLVEVPAWLRLLAQVGAAGLVSLTGTALDLFPDEPLGEVANILITLVWIVGITNAFNFFDGMDGLATGLAILLALFLGSVAVQTDQTLVAFVALAIIGAGLGFLPYNLRGRKPALIFLGDSGATFLGFLLACLAVKGEWADNNPIVSFCSPLLIFGVLIYDMIHITVERVVTGKVRCIKDWIDYVGRDHLHHRFERALGSRLASVAMIFALTVCLGLAAMVLRDASTGDAILLLTQAALIVTMVTILEHAGRR